MKNSENCQVNQTQPIPLMEVDANENANRVAKDASIVAEKYNLVAAEQYGILGGSAIHLATNKQVMYNISRQIKKPMLVCSNDARSC